MPFLRNLVKDLVEKRLWPVAVLLVAALVAAPVLIGRSGSDPAVPADVADAVQNADAADAGDAGRALVSIDEDATDRRHDGGEVRDPFTAPAAAKVVAKTDAATQTPAEDTTVPAATPSGSTGTGTGVPVPTDTGTSTPGTGTTSGGSTSGGSTSGTTTTKKTTTYHVTLRFGQTGRARDDPRPRAAQPAAVGHEPVLRLPRRPRRRQDAPCSWSPRTPSRSATASASRQPSDCQTVELDAGDTEWFDFTNPDGTVTQYQMDLVSIRKKKIASEDKVQAAFARHSRVGAELLRDAAVKATRAAKGAERYRYLPKRGVLARAKKRKRAAASAAAGAFLPGAAELMSLAPRKLQPGIAVWHWDAAKAERQPHAS